MALADALVAGGIPVVLIAAAKYALGIDLTPLAAWQGIVAVKFVVVIAFGDIAYFTLRRRARRVVVIWIAMLTLACVLCWFLYNTGATVPENRDNALTWNSTLIALYLGFFGFFGSAVGSIYATARRTRP